MAIKDIVYEWGGLNHSLFYAVNSVQGDTYDHLMVIGSAIAKYTLFPVYFLSILSVALVYGTYVTRVRLDRYPAYCAAIAETLTVLAVAYACSLAWVPVLKNLLHFPRPFAVLPEGTVHILASVKELENPFASFPSGHSEFAMLLAASLWPVLNRTGRIFAALYVIWVLWSRVALGVHFPADVTISAMLSLLVVLAVRRAIVAFELPRKLTYRITHTRPE